VKVVRGNLGQLMWAQKEKKGRPSFQKKKTSRNLRGKPEVTKRRKNSISGKGEEATGNLVERAQFGYRKLKTTPI